MTFNQSTMSPASHKQYYKIYSPHYANPTTKHTSNLTSKKTTNRIIIKSLQMIMVTHILYTNTNKTYIYINIFLHTQTHNDRCNMCIVNGPVVTRSTTIIHVWVSDSSTELPARKLTKIVNYNTIRATRNALVCSCFLPVFVPDLSHFPPLLFWRISFLLLHSQL